MNTNRTSKENFTLHRKKDQYLFQVFQLFGILCYSCDFCTSGTHGRPQSKGFDNLQTVLYNGVEAGAVLVQIMAPEGLYAAFRRFSHRLVSISHKAETDKSQMYTNLSVRLRAHPLYRAYIEYITENFKTFTETVKTQYKGVIAQRIRRTIEYENTHGHKSLIRFLQSLQNAFLRRKGMGLSALFAASMFSWNEEIITDQEISRFVKSYMLICRSFSSLPKVKSSGS